MENIKGVFTPPTRFHWRARWSGGDLSNAEFNGEANSQQRLLSTSSSSLFDGELEVCAA